MASEIRVNQIQNRSGLTTVTWNDEGLNVVGVATAFNFKTGTTNVHSTGVELVNVNTGGATATFGGPLTGTTATFSGNVSVGGVLTYEDVTRVDALGISTFREGFGVGPLAGIALTAYKDGSIRTSGIITAASFVGDGSGLTGAGPSLANGVDNRVVTATGANALTGEANLTFSGSNITVTNSSGASELTLTTPNNTDGGVYFRTGSTNAGAVSYLHTDNSMNFRVNSTTKLKINSNGDMGLGVTPSTWKTGGDFRALQIGTGLAVYGRGSGDADRGGIGVNYYHSTADSPKYIAAGNANNMYMVDGEFEFKRADSGSADGAITWQTIAKINTGFGLKADNTCKAWLCYRSEAGNEGIQDDFGVASVTDESTGQFWVTLDNNIHRHGNGFYQSIVFGSYNASSYPFVASIGYAPSHGGNNPWWDVVDNGFRVDTQRSDTGAQLDAKVFSMATFGDTGDLHPA